MIGLHCLGGPGFSSRSVSDQLGSIAGYLDRRLSFKKDNLRSGVLFSEERERKATRDSAVSRWSVRL